MNVSVTVLNGQKDLKVLQQLYNDKVLGETGQGLLEAALLEGATVKVFGKQKFYRIEKGDQVAMSRIFNLPLNLTPAASLSEDKKSTKAVWLEENIPTPNGFGIKKEEFEETPLVLEERLQEISFPVVSKPQAGTLGGKGVVTNIQDAAELSKHLKEIFKKIPKVVVEEYYGGLREYRVTLVDNEVIGFSEKKSPHVTGDGQKTIRQLVDAKNKIREETVVPLGYGLIPTSSEVESYLAKNSLNFDSLPKAGEEVTLANVKNLSSGGEPIQITDSLPAATLELCQKALAVVGLRYGGLDILSLDILKNPFSGTFLEVNYNPLLSMHFENRHEDKIIMYRKIIQAIFRANT